MYPEVEVNFLLLSNLCWYWAFYWFEHVIWGHPEHAAACKTGFTHPQVLHLGSHLSSVHKFWQTQTSTHTGLENKKVDNPNPAKLMTRLKYTIVENTRWKILIQIALPEKKKKPLDRSAQETLSGAALLAVNCHCRLMKSSVFKLESWQSIHPLYWVLHI